VPIYPHTVTSTKAVFTLTQAQVQVSMCMGSGGSRLGPWGHRPP